MQQTKPCDNIDALVDKSTKSRSSVGIGKQKKNPIVFGFKRIRSQSQPPSPSFAAWLGNEIVNIQSISNCFPVNIQLIIGEDPVDIWVKKLKLVENAAT